jgi:hypothetical protein
MKSSTLGIALTILIGGAIALTPKESNTKATAPPANTCYVPGGSGCGSSSCHNTSINTGSGFIQATFSGANNEYVPGQTYTINVTISDDTKQRFGFQAASVDQNNMQAGTFIVTNTNNTSLPEMPLIITIVTVAIIFTRASCRLTLHKEWD